MGEIVFRSAQRSVVVCGIMKFEVSAAEILNDSLKINVKHKTGKLKPAIVFLKSLASEAIIKFHQTILPQIEKRSGKILSFDGKPMKHAGVN